MFVVFPNSFFYLLALSVFRVVFNVVAVKSPDLMGNVVFLYFNELGEPLHCVSCRCSLLSFLFKLENEDILEQF
jgi:hypothetical protein